MKNRWKTALTISLTYLVLSGCQQVEPTRDSSGRLTESAMQKIEADKIDQERIYGGTATEDQ